MLAQFEAAAVLQPLLAGLRARGATAALVILVFALVAWRVRGVDFSGAIGGAVAAFLIYISAGLAAFLVVGTVFVLAAGSTRLGNTRKRELGLAERRNGRTARQVLANLSVAALCTLASLYGARATWLLAMAAALAEAGADTVASECGEAVSSHVYLVTSFRRVPVGTDGGISIAGTAASVAAALLVTLIAAWTRVLPSHWIAVAAGAAVLGTLMDSLLGATLQARGWLSNSAVNLVSTAAAALFARLLLVG